MMGHDPVIRVIENTVSDKVLKNDLGKSRVLIRREQRGKMRFHSGHGRIRQRGIPLQHREPAGDRGKRGKGKDQRQEQRLCERAVRGNSLCEEQRRAPEPQRQPGDNAAKQHLPMPAPRRALDQRRHVQLPTGGKPLLGNGLFNKP